MPFAAALSQHPVAAEAVGEVLGATVEHGAAPDLVAVFASGAHAEFLGEASAAVRTVLGPRTLVGAAAPAILAGDRLVDDSPALALWAGWGVPGRPVRLPAAGGPGAEHPAEVSADGARAAALAAAEVRFGGTLVVLADPTTFPTEAFLAELSSVRPDVAVAGGLVPAGGRPDRSALVLDGAVHHDGAVAVAVPSGRAIVSSGHRPVGAPMVVTRSEGSYLLELAGRPALDQLRALATSLPPAERSLLARDVRLGIAIDERRPVLGRGDFLVRPVLGADHRRGVLAVASTVPVGTTVQFHVRDPAGAAEDLRDSLAALAGAGALVFTAEDRVGPRPAGVDDDATVVADALGTGAVAGICCAGELGPLGGPSHLHGSTASVVVFQD